MEYSGKEEIVKQIIRYLSGESSEEEILFLKGWVEESAVNKAYYLQVKNIWEASADTTNLSLPSTQVALNNVLKRLSKPSSNRGFLFYFQRIAAILIVPVIIGSFLWIRSISGNYGSNVAFNEVTAPFGTHSAIKLADGSKVWLNSGSSLRYPDKFVRNVREVFLIGEAYFEVNSDKKHPFIVKTNSIDVKATGTRFNVTAFKDASEVMVTLVEGKVDVSKNNLEIASLKPNEHLRYNNEANRLSINANEDVYKFIAWKDGKLVFRNEPLSEVIKRIGQYYNVDIVLTGKELQEYRYRATFKEESLDEILKLLKLTSPIDYREIKREPATDGLFPKRKIVIFPVKFSQKE